MRALHRLKLSHRFTILIGLFALGFIIYGAWTFKTLDELKVNGPVYQRIVQGKDLIADILPPPEYIIESYLVTLQMHGSTDKTQHEAWINRLKTLKAEYDARHAYWEKEHLESALADAFLTSAHKPAKAFYANAKPVTMPEMAPAPRLDAPGTRHRGFTAIR
ncbi:MAG: hypothetical protein ACREX0_09945 [Noviherbaspirillum sp.]